MSRRDLIAFARSLGYAVELTSGGHTRLVHPSGATVTTASTPSDHRGYLNCRADLRRELRARGVLVEERSLADRPAPRTRAKQEPKRKPAPRPKGLVPEHYLDSFREAGPGRLQGTVFGRACELVRRVDPVLGTRWELRWREAA